MRLQPLVRARVASLGAAGAAWVESLPRVLDELAERWSLTVGRPLPGGSASYVASALTDGGEPRVLKVVLPGPDSEMRSSVGSAQGEVRTLAAARGVGYAVLHAHDPSRHALLLEALGPSLEQTPTTPERKLDLLAATLAAAWRLPLETAPPVAAGEDQASALHRMVVELDARLGGPVPGPVLRQALAYAERRAADFRAEDCVVVHGDAHPANALRAAPRPGAESGWVFVDPDGFRADPAYDAGVVVRDWVGQLQGDDPRGVLEGYCARIAALTGLDEQRIWEWGYLERVSTGLYVTDFGGEVIGRRFLASAERLLDPRR